MIFFQRSIGKEATSPATVNQAQKTQADENLGQKTRGDNEPCRSKDGYSFRLSRKVMPYDETDGQKGDKDLATEASNTSDDPDQENEEMAVEQNNENDAPPNNESGKIALSKPTAPVLGALENQNPASVLDSIKQLFANGGPLAKSNVQSATFYKEKERSGSESVSSIVRFIRTSDQSAPAIAAACSSLSNVMPYQIKHKPVKRLNTNMTAPKPSILTAVSKLVNEKSSHFVQSDNDSDHTDLNLPAESLSILEEIGNDYKALKIKHRELAQSRSLMDKYDKKIENVDAYIANMDTRLTQFEGRLYKIDEKLDKVMKFLQNCS